MGYRLIIKAGAHEDALAAFHYYESQKSGLGEHFLDALEKAYLQIGKHLQHYSYIDEDDRRIFRDIRVRRFP